MTRVLITALGVISLAILGLVPPRSVLAGADESTWESFPDGSLGQVSEFKGINGTPIAAYNRKPKGDGPFPVVVLIHGGGDSKAGTYGLGRMRTAPTANFIAEGWAVYSIDFRPKAPFHSIEWDDTCRAVETVRKLPFVDGQRVALIGGSHGGYVTARVASRCDLNCAIPCAPAAIDLIEVARAKRAGFKIHPRLDDLIQRMEKDYSAPLDRIMANPAAFKHQSAFTEVHKVRCPILLVSGRNDASSPPSVMETYAKLMQAAGKEVELYLPENGPHGFYFGRPQIPETDEAARRVVAFVRKHFGLPAKDAAQAPQPDKPAQSKAGPDPTSPATQARQARWLDPDKTEPAGTKYRTFPSNTINGDVSYLIYLPPDYDKEKDRRYPVLYWLHGGGGSQHVGAYFVELTDRAIRAGRAPALIVVLVNGLPSSLFNDSSDGQRPVESVIIRDLIPHIDATYRTIADRKGRGVEGFSMGGYGAAHLGFKFPELFGVVSNLAGAVIDVDFFATYQNGRILKEVFNGDREAFQRNHPFTLAERNTNAIRDKTFVRIIVGDQDTGRGTLDANRQLHQLLDQLKIQHQYVEVPDVRHSYRALYDGLGDKAFAFFAKAFGATDPEPPDCYDRKQLHLAPARDARKVEPFEILDGLYYVGNTQVSAHLLTTKEGLLLIDSTMPHEVPWLLESIRKLGFKPSDVKVVIGGHWHLDHIGGHWYFQKHFGAQTWLHEQDAPNTMKGGWTPGRVLPLDGTIGTLSLAFPPFKTDRSLKDGEVVEWGGRKLTFRHAPGHTPGTILIEFPLQDEDGKTYRAGMLGGLSPGLPEFTATCKRLRELNVEVWLGAHPNQNRTLAKAEQLKAGKGPNPFIDPQGWKKFLDMMIARDTTAAPAGPQTAALGAEPAAPVAQEPKPEAGAGEATPQNSLARLEIAWVEPDKTEPAGTRYKTFHSKTVQGDVSYLIYLPPNYDKGDKKRYPVLYWLHGTGGKQSRAGEVVKRLDQAIRDGKAPPLIVVLVNGLRGATMYCDTKDGKWPLESVIINDLIPHVDATYRTIAKREARAVEGFSMGGFGAAHFGFKYPDLFGVVSILAPALLGPDLKIRWQEHFSFVFSEDLDAFQANNPFQLAAQNAGKLRDRTVIRLVPHDEAGKWLIPRCDQLHAVLDKHQIAHEYDPRTDVKEHNYVLLYEALGEKALGFYTKAFANISTGGEIDKKPEGPAREPEAKRDEIGWEKLPDGSMGRAVTYRTADQLDLAAYLRKPARDGPFPVVVFLPGGAGQTDAAWRMGRSTNPPIADFLAAGWAVFAISYRPPQLPTPNMDEREWADTANAMARLRAFPFVDAKRVALIGHSHGARVVTMMASRVDARCGVAMAPVTLNLVEMMKRREGGEKFSPAALRMMDNMEKIHGAKILEKPDLFLRYSPFPEVKQVRFPLLLMYAEDDSGGPVEIVKTYVEELRKAGREVDSYYPKKGGHGVFFGRPVAVPETEETVKRAVAFIRQYFGVGRSPQGSTGPDQVPNLAEQDDQR